MQAVVTVARLKRTRLINTSEVLREIWIRREISRSQIAKSLDLDKSTITSIVGELIDLGIVTETDEGEAGPRGGRKPVFLRLVSTYGSVLGIEMRPEGYKAVAVDLEGKIIGTWDDRMVVTGATLRQVFLDAAARVRGEMDGGLPLLGIGVGLSGVVNPQKSLIRYSIPLQIESPWDFRTLVADGYDLPVFIENDANACAWGELVFHRSKRLKDFVFVLSEFRDAPDPRVMHERTAVGLGVVIGGSVHYGRSFSAGEFRSVLCTERSRGQFSLEEKESFRIPDDTAVLSRFIRELARNVAMLVNTFNLGHVFLGGDIERYRTEVQEVFTEEIERNWPYPDEVRCAIRFSSLGDRSVAYGVAGMVLHRLFADISISQSVRRFHLGGPSGLEVIGKPSPVGG